jgi:peptidyl-tRNA hydrolase, PTH1 family
VKLIIGLGNPGSKYLWTRHNAGFWMIDHLVEDCRISWDDSKSDKFLGTLSKGAVDGVDCVLVKPQTFMNLSGRCVQRVAQFYKVPPRDWIVIHDDIDLASEKVRLREGGGGHGGHNGIRSITEECGTADFARIKVGVGRPAKPEDGAVADYVLRPMSEAEVGGFVKASFPEVMARLKELLKR